MPAEFERESARTKKLQDAGGDGSSLDGVDDAVERRAEKKARTAGYPWN